MFSHIGSKEQACVCLIHGITFRTGEVDKMLAVLQHLRTAGLFSGLVCQVRRSHCCAWRNSVDTNVGIDQAHSDILCQRIDRALG